ncbi:MAG: ATPase [Nanoarchaeota archaeon]|nr:ATPase [Nanoarchaeota archaeon]
MRLNFLSKENKKKEVEEVVKLVNSKKVKPKKIEKKQKKPIKQNVKNRRVELSRRIKSGIPGLDELMGGGFLPHSVVLVTGKTGSSKTIVSAQFLYKGIIDHGENGVYITTEQRADDIADDMLTSFGWDFHKLMDEKKLSIIEIDPGNVRQLPYLVKQKIEEINAKRVVIDSTSMFSLFFDDVFETRRKLFSVYKILKDMDIVTLFTAEILEESKGLSRFGVIEFMVDGIISLQFIGIAAKFKRALMVRKMRRTDHSNKIYPFEITNKGIIVRKI